MLHPLPFTSFGEIVRLGLEAHVSCSRCYSSRRISLDDDRLRARQFAGTRFRCTNERWNGEVCGGLGSLKIQPAELLPVGGANTLTYLWCDRCMPPWQIDQVQLDKPPWSDVNLQRGDRFRCPACRGRVDWHIHGPAWRPTYARHLNRNQPVPPGLAQALADLLRKEQRNRLGQLQNMRRRGELR